MLNRSDFTKTTVCQLLGMGAAKAFKRLIGIQSMVPDQVKPKSKHAKYTPWGMLSPHYQPFHLKDLVLQCCNAYQDRSSHIKIASPLITRLHFCCNILSENHSLLIY